MGQRVYLRLAKSPATGRLEVIQLRVRRGKGLQKNRAKRVWRGRKQKFERSTNGYYTRGALDQAIGKRKSVGRDRKVIREDREMRKGRFSVWVDTA